MGLWELFILAVGLSMDAFSVAVCKGLSVCQVKKKHVLTAGIYFGVFQALMPAIGYLLGTGFQSQIQAVDHWIAFGLLLAVGGAMLRNAIMNGEDQGEEDCGPVRSARSEWLALLTTAVATSIDAAAVGAGLALVDVDMVTTSALIGAVTFAVAFGGVLIGRAAGAHLGRWAEMAGGVVLIGLGAKILLEHTMG